MQRNSTDSKSLNRDLLWLIPLIIYESLGTIYYLLPPLFGLFVALLIKTKTERYLPLVMIYFLFIEADHSLFMFSSWIYLFFFFKVVLPLMQDYIICKKCILVLGVTLGYFGYFVFINSVYLLLGASMMEWNFYLLAFYVVVESILAVFLL